MPSPHNFVVVHVYDCIDHVGSNIYVILDCLMYLGDTYSHDMEQETYQYWHIQSQQDNIFLEGIINLYYKTILEEINLYYEKTILEEIVR